MLTEVRSVALVLLAFGMAVLAMMLSAKEASAQNDANLKQLIASAPKLETEDLCVPVKSVRRGMLLWAPNPDGKSWDLLQIYFPQYGGPNTIVIIDLGTGEVKTIQTERGWNFHLCPSVIAPNGKLFISILDRRLRQRICIYNPATNELKIDAVKMPDGLLGETHPLVLGTDGKLYAIGQHPSRTATAAQIDPDTLRVTFYGPIGPSHAPNPCWGYSGGADDRYIYIASGKIPWYLIAYDRRTGKWKVLAKTDTVGGYVSVSQHRDGCTGYVRKNQKATPIRGWLYRGEFIPIKSPNEKPPWSQRAMQLHLPPRPEINDALADPDENGFAEIWVRPREAKVHIGPKLSPSASRKVAVWKRYRFRVPLYPQTIYRLMELPDGRLFGTAGAYLGNFIYDPNAGEAKHLGKIHLSHYATAICDGKIYMSGYPTSPLYVYDPSKPWTAGKFIGNRLVRDGDEDANPRYLLHLGTMELAGTHKMYAAVTGADGKVYFGGRWIRNGACGGLAWYDPKTGEVGGIWKPFSNYQITHMTTVNGGRIIVISTRRVEDFVLGKPKPKQGALWLFDVMKCELVGKFEPIPRVKGTGPIVGVGNGRVLGWTHDPGDPRASILYLVNVGRLRMKIIFKRCVPFPLPVAIGSNQKEPWDFRMGPDGMVWTFINNVLVRIDPKDGSIHPVGKLGIGGRIAFSGGCIYLGGTTAIRRIKGLTVRGEGHVNREDVEGSEEGKGRIEN